MSKEPANNQALTEKVKTRALELGADLVGIAPVTRFAQAPARLRPQGLLPTAQSVVVAGIHHPDATIELSGEPDPQTILAYEIQYFMNDKLDRLSFAISRLLEEEGYASLPLAASNIWRYAAYKEEPTEFAPDLSNIHAAVAAGLGEFGLSGLFLSPEYGPRQRLVCVVTSAPLEPTPLYDGPPLCDRCGACIRACPSQALSRETEGFVKIEIDGRQYTYLKKNKWRCAWGEHFDLDLKLPKPEVITKDVLLAQLAQHGRRGGEMGSCLRYCLPPHLRVSDPDYSRVWRRKGYRTETSPLPDRSLTEKILASAAAQGAAKIMVKGITPEEEGQWPFLPHAKSAVLIGVPGAEMVKPQSMAPLIFEAGQRLAKFIALDLARELEERGYPTTIVPGPAPEAQKELDSEYAAVVLTCAHLAPSPVRVLPPLQEEPLALARRLGADLVGVIETAKLAAALPTLARFRGEKVKRLDLIDKGPIHGPVDPQVLEEREEELPSPLTLFPGLKKALILGLRLPQANLVWARNGDAEAVGPYAFATYQVWRELALLALQVAHALKSQGYQAVVTPDPYGHTGLIATPRGRYPDATSSAFAAYLAGLCDLGWHGAALTSAWGTAQRFLTIMTDAPLPETSPQKEERVCDACGACVAACPVQALQPPADVLFAYKDQLRCEWVSKYGLKGEEGPWYLGEKIDQEPPNELDAASIAAAWRARDPVQKHFTCTVENCLQACQKHLQAKKG